MISSLYLMSTSWLFYWCKYDFSAFGVSVTSLYLMQIWLLWIWCQHVWYKHGFSVFDVNMTSLYLVSIWQLYIWYKHDISVFGINMTSLYLVSTWHLCVWYKHDFSVFCMWRMWNPWERKVITYTSLLFHLHSTQACKWSTWTVVEKSVIITFFLMVHAHLCISCIDQVTMTSCTLCNDGKHIILEFSQAHPLSRFGVVLFYVAWWLKYHLEKIAMNFSCKGEVCVEMQSIQLSILIGSSSSNLCNVL